MRTDQRACAHRAEGSASDEAQSNETKAKRPRETFK